MSLVPSRFHGESLRLSGDGRIPGDDRASDRDNASDARQAAWFGLEDENELVASGVYAGVVFNRPIEQVLTYRVSGRLGSLIRPGHRVRAPLGRGDKLAIGYCVSVDPRPPEGLDPHRIKEVVEILDTDPPDRPQDARAHAVAGRLLRLLLGAGAGRRGAGGGEETLGDPDRDIPGRARGDAPRRSRIGSASAPSSRPSSRPCWKSSPGPTSRSRPPTSAGWPDAAPSRSRHSRSWASCTPSVDVWRSTRAEVPRASAPSVGRPEAPARRGPRGRSARLDPDARAGGDAGADRAGPRVRRVRPLPHPRRDRQRQDRGLSLGDRAGRGAGPRGHRARPGDQPDAADDPPIPPPVRPGRRPAQPPERRRAAPPLAEHRLGRGPGRRRRPVGDLRAGAASSGSSSSTRSTRAHSSRRRCPDIMPATWRSSGPRWRGCRSSSARPRPRWRPGGTRYAGDTPGWRCRPGSAAGPCPRWRSSTCGTRRPRWAA